MNKQKMKVPSMEGIVLSRAGFEDLEEILALQKLAYLSEARRYNDYGIPPLTQTIDEIRSDYGALLFLKAVSDGRIVGSIRGRVKDGTCQAGRLMVHPGLQRRGIGASLVRALEAEMMSDAETARFELFTGAESFDNIRLYKRLGYQEFKTEPFGNGKYIVYLEKTVSREPSEKCCLHGEMMDITIRHEGPEDRRETETLVREAFWDKYKPGCDEHLLLHKLRKTPAFIPELNFVACEGGRIVGNIVYSRAKVVGDDGREHPVLCMGPLSVPPSLQKRGIGSMLMRHSIAEARKAGHRGVVLYGDPVYYRRFGFRNAAVYSITTAQGENFDAFMALELSENGLEGVEGRFFEDPVFRIDELELKLFEQGFPYREKHVTDTQLK
jgi:predicted N-acetyltransferase YhbS